ncbi:SurA N-terminal domain-containing protein [Thalassotalea fusca]
MLENIRESSQGLVAKIILGFIILTFAVAGIGSYTNSVDTSVAEVNGVKISQSEFDKAYQSQRNRMAQQFGEMFETLSADPSYMANFRKGVLDNLISETLVDQAAKDLAIRISDARIKETIRTMPEFQVNGVFDNNRYLALINQAGFYQSSDFRDYLRVEMARRQLTQALLATEFSVPYQHEQLTKLQNQKRDLKVAQIASEQFKTDIAVTDDEINQYFLANQSRFETQEKVKVDYIALNVADIATTVSVSDDEIETYYQENMVNYQKAPQRRISHILIEGEDDAAQAQAQSLLEQIKNGADFAEMAKQHSADTFSGENGGDLEWLEPGVMDPAFDEAALALNNVGDVSEVVKTDFGFHLIQLTEFQEGNLKALADVKEDIHAALSTNKAQDKFFELQQEMARLSFEFPDSLEDAAGAVNVEVKTTDWLSRFGNAAPFDNAKAIETAFSDLVLQEQLNSDVVEINDDLVVVMRLNEYQAAKVKPLAEVSDQIKELLVAQKAAEKAQLAADELLAGVKANSDVTAQLAALGATFEQKADIARYGSDVDAAIAREAFKLPHPAEGSVSAGTVTMGNGDLAIVVVENVSIDDSVEVPPTFAQQQTQQLAQSAYNNFVDSLRENAEVKQKSLVVQDSQL